MFRRKKENLEEKLPVRTIEVPEEHQWRQDEMFSALKEYISKIDMYRASLSSGMIMRGIGLLGAIYGSSIAEKPNEFASCIGVGVLAWIGAKYIDDFSRANFDNARDQYLSHIIKFDSWRFANDKNGYEKIKEEK